MVIELRTRRMETQVDIGALVLAGGEGAGCAWGEFERGVHSCGRQVKFVNEQRANKYYRQKRLCV